MRNYFSNLIHLLELLFALVFNIKKQRKFLDQTLGDDILNSRKNDDGSLDEHDYRKIKGYYGVAVTAMLGESYCTLRGRKMSADERLSVTCLGACTGLFDDLFDKRNLPLEVIRKFIEIPYEVEGGNNYEKLFLTFVRKALDHSANVPLVKKYAFEVYEAQILSKLQVSSEISRERIWSITQEKGGGSLLFYRSTFHENLSPEEVTMLRKLGAIGQLENDIFDVYKDHQAGVRTLATTTLKIEELRQLYMGLMNEVLALIDHLPYPKKNKDTFKRINALFICRGLVCLDFLEKNESLTNNTFKVEQYQRSQLVCDMGKPYHFLKSIHYYAKTQI